MSIRPGVHLLGSDNATLQILTYRDGLGAKAGHDLVIDVTNWEATVEVSADSDGLSVELIADPGSLHVREGRGGIKPLTDRDRLEIRRNIRDEVLPRESINFRSTRVEPAGDGLSVEGELGLGGNLRPLAVQLELTADGHLRGTVPLTQSDWGIEPYSGLMGALKVRDTVDVVFEARLPPD